MTCTFDQAKIQDYIENMLSPDERQAVEAHLAVCPECHREWVEMNNLMQLLSGLPMEELPEGFKEELHEKLVGTVQEKQEEKTRVRPLLHLKKHFKAYSAAAAVLVVGMISVNSLYMNKATLPEGVYNLAAPAAMEDSASPKMKSTARGEAPAEPEMDAAVGTYGAAPEGVSMEAPPAEPAPAQNGQSGGNVTEGTAFTASGADTGIQERKVIRSGSANLSTLSYDKTVDALTAYANQHGGYVENLYTGNQYEPIAAENALKSGNITLRIPVGSFDDFFKSLGAYGKVSEKTLTAEDISNQYRDTYNQAVNLEVRETKLREIMGTAKTVQDVMAVEAELSRVRGEINQLKGTLQQWDALVSLSRITINITEVRSLETQVSGLDTSLMSRIREAFIASVNSVISGTENLAVWAVSAVPWLLTGGIILGALWIPVRKAGWIRRIKK